MNTVAIVGGGYAGVACVIHLARAAAERLRIVLIEPSAEPGRGLAHASPHPDHRLNGQPNVHSLYPEAPLHFEQWMSESGTLARDPAALTSAGAIYARRADFGRYANEQFRACMAANPSGSTVEHWRARVTAIDAASRSLTLDDGRRLPVTAAMLALGWNACSLPRELSAFADDPRCIADPWQHERVAAIDRDASVLIVGTGLTSLDLIASLSAQSHRGPVIALSRKGQQPPVQTSERSPIRSVWDTLLAPDQPFVQRYGLPPTLRQALRCWHAERERLRVLGQPELLAFDAVRDSVRLFWPLWSSADKRRFARHLKSRYDLIRYRSPPQTRAIVDRMLASGQLRIVAGRLAESRRTGLRMPVRYIPREEHGARDRAGAPDPSGPAGALLEVDALINCTGPQPRPSRSDNPLWRSLIADGLARDHPSGLGIDVDGGSRIIDRTGQPVDWLFATGPITLGQFGEISAVPQITFRVLAWTAEFAGRIPSLAKDSPNR